MNSVFTLTIEFRLIEWRRSGKGTEEQKKAAESVSYLLNYFEFISNGVLIGDLDAKIVRGIKRGTLCFFYDKCEPYILAVNKRNPRAFQALIKMRTHYREP